MRRMLHILTKEDDATAGEVISRQRAQSDYELKVVNLTTGQPDYANLLKDIFAADSVAVW